MFVMRSCSIMEKTQKSGEGVKTTAKLAEDAADRRERMDRLESEFSVSFIIVRSIIFFISLVIRFSYDNLSNRSGKHTNDK